ncbi:hypothetical protein HS99_0008775 [Kitasatospora aureofaciens]|uniref:Uncharacterized protein n=1 Tax=Kitasatospora aureofaciens TaxID=1894 RepID=A0A1E7N1P5_KITAU|nr:hypothetical protein B6264_00075 [Kitasatospora aureofaciens]OEV34586.1 hypothetical protein HS99_0008775 [Kitasatospora aureofaciens]QEV03568.1 hypothetical protein CP971_34080 [Streptomyces viridifaciens]
MRFLEEVDVQTVHPRRRRVFRRGEEEVMVQWGLAGRRVDRGIWWTSIDVNGAYIVMAPSVEVLEVLEEQPPTSW